MLFYGRQFSRVPNLLLTKMVREDLLKYMGEEAMKEYGDIEECPLLAQS